MADAQFRLDKQTYAARTGRVRGADDVIAYHLRQSFVPGEITPEEANRLGDGSTLDDLLAVLSGQKEHTPRKQPAPQAAPPRVNLLVDIQAKLQAGKGAGYSRKFRQEHEEEILLHQAAKEAFNELNVKKLPTIKELQTEYAKLLTDKKAAYAEYRQARAAMRELLTVKNNVDRVLAMEQTEPTGETFPQHASLANFCIYARICFTASMNCAVAGVGVLAYISP